MTGILQMLLGSAGQNLGDASFEYVTALLPGNGSNNANNNTFIDSSTVAASLTRAGNTTQGTNNPFRPVGYYSGFFNGSNQSLTTSSSTLWDINSNSQTFTVEAWINPSAINSSGPNNYRFTSIISKGVVYVSFGFTSSGVLRFYTYDGSENYINSASGVIVTGQWQHVALVSNAGAITMYVNGTSVATGSLIRPQGGGTGVTPRIGAADTGAAQDWFNGYMSNLRITNTAVYTSAFDPPTTALTAISGTQFLTLQNNRFIDNSTNNFTITSNNAVSVDPLTPYELNTAYTTAAYGGSAYLDGSGDYVRAPANANYNFSTNSWTMEWWLYANSYPYNFPRPGGFAYEGTPTDSAPGFFYGTAQNGSTIYYREKNAGDRAITINSPTKQWFHLAVTNNAGTLRVYLNGVQIDSWAGPGTTYYNNNPYTLGNSSNASPTEPWDGYIAGARVVNGTSLYPNGTTFTPPTAPLTAVANTVLLMNSVNGTIIDYSMINDFETVGNMVTSTAQSKWGGSSMYWDGSSWLSAPPNPGYRFQSSDFTIEMWIYVSIASQKLAWHQNGSASYTITASTNVPTGQWNHVAVTKSGTTIRLFLNGTLDGSGTVSAVENNNDPLFIGKGADHTTGSGRDMLHCGETGGASPKWFFYLTGNGTGNFSGYMNDIRITKGLARYTASFTAPTSAFPLF